MATRADVQRLVDANRQISRLATSDVRRLWSTLDTDDPVEVRETLEELLPGLVDTYGDVAATVAADWYDEQRAAAGVRGTFTAMLAAPVAAEAVRANARWAIGPLFQADRDPESALGLLTLETDRMVRQPGRDTRTLSASRDPARPRYARVPTSPKPCAFCTMLASRGPVFHTESAAGGQFNSYHADCGCEVVPIYDGQPLPEGYDPDAMFQQYADARQEAGSDSTSAILSKMRQMQGIN